MFADFNATFRVKQGVGTRPRAYAQVMTAFRADIERGLQVFFVKHRFAGGAFYPDALGDAPCTIVATVDARRQNFLEPTHDLFLLNTRPKTGFCSFTVNLPHTATPFMAASSQGTDKNRKS